MVASNTNECESNCECMRAFYLMAQPGEIVQLIEQLIDSEEKCAELTKWKSAQLFIEKTWDVQKIGKELNIKCGDSIRDKILPAIINLKNNNSKLLEKLKEQQEFITESENRIDSLIDENDILKRTNDELNEWNLAFQAVYQQSYELWQNLDLYTDSDEACQHVMLRQLEECMGTVITRLLKEHPDQHHLYWLHVKDMRQELLKLRDENAKLKQENIDN